MAYQDISELVAVRNKIEVTPDVNHIIIYGASGAGKTCIAASLVRMPGLNRMIWFDLENGFKSIIHLKKLDGDNPEEYEYTPEELERIELIRLRDTAKVPRAGETILKSFTATKDQAICKKHGKIDCKECITESNPFVNFHLDGLGPNDLVVIDSGTQLSTSMLNISKIRSTFKDNRLHYVEANNDSNNLFSSIQASNTNVLMLTHELHETDDSGRVKNIWPLYGTQTYARTVGKFFDQIVYASCNYGKFAVGSGSGYKQGVFTRSRTSIALEDYDHADLTYLIFPNLAKEARKSQGTNKGGNTKANKLSITL